MKSTERYLKQRELRLKINLKEFEHAKAIAEVDTKQIRFGNTINSVQD